MTSEAKHRALLSYFRELIASTCYSRIAVLSGGTSSERRISLDGGKNIALALERSQIPYIAIDTRSKHWLQRLLDENVDVALIALHGTQGEDGGVQALLEAAGIPYTGSGVAGSLLAMDKLLSKWRFEQLGVATLPYWVVSRGESMDLDGMAYPVFVKPLRSGSSLGVSRVNHPEQLETALQAAWSEGESALIEPCLCGGEYHVGILQGRALPAIRVESQRDFYDYDAKYNDQGTRFHLPCGLEPAQENKLQLLALDAFRALGCSGWGRVDVMCDEKSEFYVLEVNTVPGFTEHSLVPMAAKHVGLSFADFIQVVLSTAHVRSDSSILAQV